MNRCKRINITSVIQTILAFSLLMCILTACTNNNRNIHTVSPPDSSANNENPVIIAEPYEPILPPPTIVEGQIEDIPEMRLSYHINDEFHETIITSTSFTWDVLFTDDSIDTMYATSLSPLDAEFNPYNIDAENHTTAVRLGFINPPESLTIKRWRDDFIGKPTDHHYSYEIVNSFVEITTELLYESDTEITIFTLDLSLRNIGYVYNVRAEWSQGYGNYVFRVMSLPWHAFSPHSIPETDPSAFPRIRFYTQLNENMTLYPVHFGKPEDYTDVIGVTTFRGNNFRNNPTWGYANITEQRLEVQYELRIGSLGGWTGVGWPGQPVIIKWDIEMQQIMNIHPHMYNEDGLVEVIQSALDGWIYFFELFTGEETRPRINFGEVIKAGVTLDPRGYPLLYVGQGDSVRGGRFGYFIFSLIDGTELFYLDGRDVFSSRRWGAFDGNPLIDSQNDRLILAAENGVIYNILLNTDFNRDSGTISIDPIISRYKHVGTRRLGTENSPAGFGRYIFFSDNSGVIQCLNLHTFEPVWIFDAGDDTDASLVLEWESENNRLVIYTGTEVDLVGRAGYAYIRKLDASTGEELWVQRIRCGFNEAVNGGVVATPIVGKNDISHLVIFSVARTLDRARYGTVIAFCKETGDEVWEFAMTGFGWSSPVAVYNEDGTGFIIVSDSNGRMFLLRGTTGEELYRINVGSNVEASPAVFENMLVVGTRGQRILGIKLK